MSARSILISPVFIVALIVLVLNDHFLKAAYPASFLVGKLSDFAGLVVFAGLLAVVLSRIWSGRTALFVSHVLAGVVLAAWKLAPVEHANLLIQQFVPFAIRRVKDPTDLIALAILPPSWLYFSHRISLIDRRAALTAVRRVVTGAVFSAAMCSILATSPPMYLKHKSVDLEPWDEFADELLLFEQLVAAEGLIIRSRTTVGSGRIDYRLDEFEKTLIQEDGDSVRVGAYSVTLWFELRDHGLEVTHVNAHNHPGLSGARRYIVREVVEPWRIQLEGRR